jgi:enoyl-CoA hydratase/carnithine racemase
MATTAEMTPREELAWALFDCIDEAPEAFRVELGQALRAYAERHPESWRRTKQRRGLLSDLLESIEEAASCGSSQQAPTGARVE